MQMLTPEENDNVEEYRAAMRMRTDPSQSYEPSPIRFHPSPTVKRLRGMLTEARAFLGEVRHMRACT